MKRPPTPSLEPRSGYHYEATAVGPDHTLAVEVLGDLTPKPCRYMLAGRSCKAPSVAIIRRGQTGSIWHYCPDHLFGRWIEDGKVYFWRLVANERSSTDA